MDVIVPSGEDPIVRSKSLNQANSEKLRATYAANVNGRVGQKEISFESDAVFVERSIATAESSREQTEKELTFEASSSVELSDGGTLSVSA